MLKIGDLWLTKTACNYFIGDELIVITKVTKELVYYKYICHLNTSLFTCCKDLYKFLSNADHYFSPTSGEYCD